LLSSDPFQGQARGGASPYSAVGQLRSNFFTTMHAEASLAMPIERLWRLCRRGR